MFQGSIRSKHTVNIAFQTIFTHDMTPEWEPNLVTQQRLGEMGQKEHFWPKTDTFWPKTAKKSKTRIFPQNFFCHFLKDQKIGSYGKNREKNYQRLGEMGRKEHFWPKTAKNSQTRIFAKNLKRHKSKFYGCQTSWKKPEQIIARFQLQNRNERTHARTHGWG